MSVINQVLVELERRRASGGDRAGLPDHVRALPDNGSDSRGWWLAGGVGLAAVLAAGAWAMQGSAGWPARGSSAGAADTAVVPAAGPRGDGAGEARAAPAAPEPLPLAGRLSLELAAVPALPGAELAPAAAADPVPTARVLERIAEARPASREVTTAAAERPELPGRPAGTSTTGKGTAMGASREAVRAVPAPADSAAIEKNVRQPTPRDQADAAYRQAATQLHQGAIHDAREGFRAALRHYPAHHGARQALAALLIEGHMPAEAEAVLQEGLRLAPGQIGFAMTCARLQVDRGDLTAAVATLQGGLDQARDNPDYRAFLAALLQRQGRHEDAIAHFRAALNARPAAGVWWLGLAVSLQAAQRTAEAREAYGRARAAENMSPGLAAFADQRLRQIRQ